VDSLAPTAEMISLSFAVLQKTFLLLVIYQIKHFVADYPLQTPYMLKKFSPGWDFIVPLSAHCLVHAVVTFLVCMWWSPDLWWLSIVDFVAHFLMDRVKSGPRYLGRYNNSSSSHYWIAFGFDQMFHHLTHLYIVWVLITHRTLITFG
jgi:hypothetical protein